MSNDYILLNSKVAPEAFVKVLEAKKMLSSGRTKKIHEAISFAGISRSTFYKYKDYVYEYNADKAEGMFTLFFELADISGVLSDILKIYADGGYNVLTINQNIPVNGCANVTVTARSGKKNMDYEKLAGEIRRLDGVNKVQLLAVQ